VLDVGQCGFDHRTIAAYLADEFGALVEPADSFEEARQALERGKFDLVLVNRVFDLDGSSGLELIRTLKEGPDQCLGAVPVMLVSNYPEAQEAAVELGAQPGFGKSELQSPATFDRLKVLLG
jgi:two-component system chemotaxis response regulator CheY